MKKITFILTALLLLLSSAQLFSQKAVLIGANQVTPDGIAFVATEDIPAAEIIYFTENEYVDASNAFDGLGESVVAFTVGPGGLSTGDVVFIKETGTDTFTVSCSSGCGTALKTAGSGFFSLATSGESIFAYGDSDNDPTNGVTEIYSVLYTVAGTLPVSENPLNDFPNAVVVDGFGSGAPSRTEFNASRDGVSKAILENPTNYTNGSANADLSIVAFTNLNLAGVNPVVTLTSTPASVAENSGTPIVYTFARTGGTASPLTVNFNVGGTATFNTDYTQSGAASFTAGNGTVTIGAGNSSANVTISPSGDTDLEANETVQLTVTSGTGYDAGSPGAATGTINNDDTMNITPLVAVVGTNHSGSEGFSFVALQDIVAATQVYFTENPFDMSSLSFSGAEGVMVWTAPAGGVSRGEVIVATETAPNTFSTTCNSGTCGGVAIVSGNFDLASMGEAFFAYQDTDTDHTNGVSQVDAVLFTGTSATPGGTIPPAENPTTKYIGSVLVDGFAAVAPSRTEYDPSKRNTTVDQANFQNTSNWLPGQAPATLSTVPFDNIIISSGSANPTATVTVSPASVAEDGATNLVFTFNLSANATSDITINFSVDGTATFNTDYTAVGAASFDASSGTVVISNGTSSSQVTVDPTADGDVEVLETVEIMLASGTGYDGGSPNDATGSISNDDTLASDPLVAITGMNHTTADGFSFVAAKDIPAGTVIYFSEDEFDNNTLMFSSGEAVLQWTSPGTIVPKGDVIVVSETATDTFTLTCNPAASGVCGSIAVIVGGFATATNGETLYAYEDDDTDPTNGVTDIFAVLYTGNTSTPGGNIPAVQDPSGIFLSALVVDGFPAIAPDRTEYDPTLRNVPVGMADFENVANWVHAQTNAPGLSPIPFTNLDIVDTEAPVITCPANIDLSNAVGLCAAVTMLTDPTATDNISTIFIFNGIRSDGMALGDPYPVGVTTITWTAEDEAGNVSTSCDQTATVTDTEAPNAVCMDFTVQLDAAGIGSLTPADVDGGSTDNCNIASLAVDIDTFTIADLGLNIVELTVTDDAGLSSTCNANVTVEDNIDPDAVCIADYSLTVNLDATGNASILAADIDNGSSDASGIASISVNPSSFDCSNEGENIVTLTVTDNNGNISTCNTIILVHDGIPPDITCPANIMVSSSDGNPVVVTVPNATATDNCALPPAISFTRSDNAALGLGDPFPIGTTQILWTATDDIGNFSSCIQDVTVTFTASMNNDIVSFTVPGQVGVSAIDNVAKTVMAKVPFGTVLSNLTPTIGVSPDAMINPATGIPQDFTGPVMYTVTAQDNTEAVWTVTVDIADDVTPPVISCPGTIVVVNDPGVCGAVVNFVATATDERPGVMVSTIPASGSLFPVGTTNVLATATDAAGNMASCNFDVTVNDTEAPIIICPLDVIVNIPFGETATNVNFPPAIASDNCPGTMVVTTPINGSVFSLGVTNVSATATDAAGNMASCNFNVTVVEDPPTVLTVLEFVLINADTNADIGPITNGAIIDVSTLPTTNLNIRATTTADTESVRLELSGSQTNGRTENVAPYALFGDNAGNYAAHVFALGPYNLEATPYSGNGLGGTAGTALNVNFEFVNPTIGSPLILVDADTDAELFGLTEGLVINKSVVGDLTFGIIFNPDFNPNGVHFNLSGPINESRSEGSSPPYSLFGDIGVNIQGMMFPAGAYTLVANPTSGPTITVNFEVIDENPACLAFDVLLDDTTNPTLCEGLDGSITIMVAGGTPPLDYDWSHDNTLESPTAIGLAAGDYSVTVTDDNGCTETLMVSLNDPPLPIVTLDPFADVLDTDAPFALSGGLPLGGNYDGPVGVSGGMFDPSVGAGTYEIFYDFKDANGCAGSASQTITVLSTTTLAVTGFVLVNTDTDTDIMSISEGMVLDLDTFPTANLSIRANATGDVESVGFVLTGAQSSSRTENVPPYALFGDNGGDYFPHVFVPGSYSLTATPYSANNKGGTIGTPMSINFDFIDEGPMFFTIKLYPNPAVNQIHIETQDPKVKMRAIMVHDVKGRTVSKTSTAFLSQGDDYTLPVNDLPAGVYYMSITNSKGFTHKQPFIVRK